MLEKCIKEVVEAAEVDETALYARFKASVLKSALFVRGSVVLAGVSGGVDSAALLRLIQTLSNDLCFTLVVCHLNHNLRGAEAERDMDFTKELAFSLGLGFEGKTLDSEEITSAAGSTQAAAREARYSFFESVAAKVGASRITTAHTMDDVSETMLMRFINGAGLGGLTGIPRVRSPYVRPLIDFTRAEIEAFVAEIGQPYVVDSSNSSDKYLRNDIRHNLIGLIKERYNPNLLENLSRTASNLKRDDDFLNRSASVLFDKALLKTDTHEVILDRNRLKQAHPALLSRLLLKATEHFGARAGFCSNHVDSMLRLISAENPSGRLDLPKGLFFIREYAELRLTDIAPVEAEGFDLALTLPGTTVLPKHSLPSGSVAGSCAGQVIITAIVGIAELPAAYKESDTTAYFDLNAILYGIGATEAGEKTEGLRVRSFTAGDRITPFGHNSEQKLKELFIDAKVPRPLRPLVPLITVAATIVWAVGVKRSALYPVTEKSRQLLRVEFAK